jgi:fatty-acyl-CoA synthase
MSNTSAARFHAHSLPPHPGMSRLSEKQAADHGEKTALTYDGIDYSYAEVHRRVLVTADDLHRRGIRREDRVAYLGPNHPAAIETLLACLRIGAIFIPLNWRLAAPELDYQLENAEVTFLRADPSMSTTTSALTVDTPTEVVDWAPGILPEDASTGAVPAADVDGDDPAFLLYTSGTTGRPKGAVLTHANILWNAFNLLLNTDLTPADSTLVAAPLFHVAALDQQVMTSFIRGAHIVLEPKWDVDVVFDAIEKHRLTWLFGVTTMFADLVRSPRWATTDLSSVRFVNSGGAPIPVPLIHDYQDRGILFCQGYGLTETAPGATFLSAVDALRKPGSAGRPVPFTEVGIVDAAGNPCEPDVHGEIVIRGPNIMSGYWNNSAATDGVFPSGRWFHTGDIGYIDAEGFLFIVDRLKDMFVSGGENVYPAEVESTLFTHPSVDEAAIVAEPDERWGEVGHAFIVPSPDASPTAEELRDFLLPKLAKYKVPKYFSVVESLPRTGSGKVHKTALRRTTLTDHSTAPQQSKDHT